GEEDVAVEVVDWLEGERRLEGRLAAAGALDAADVPGQPVEAVLGRDELDPREALADAGHDQLGDRPLRFVGADHRGEAEVVDAEEGALELRVLDPEQPEAERRVEDLALDAINVHVLYPRRRVPAAR